MNHGSYLRCEPISRPQNTFPITAQVLRRWCVPETILAITNLHDEEFLLLHAIAQARRSGAKVLLVHVLNGKNPAPEIEGKMHLVAKQSFPEFAQATLHRMAEYMRWSGVQCETRLLRGLPANEICVLAGARSVERILMVAENRADESSYAPRTLAEEIIAGVSVPVCTISRSLTHPWVGERPPGGITLAVSLHSDCTVPLAFACRLAQEHRTLLKVVHVFTDDGRGVLSFDQSPISIASRLPLSVLREAELFCPLEITVREGEAALEILKYTNSGDQGFLVLGPIATTAESQTEQASVLHRVISDACCPVITFGQNQSVRSEEAEYSCLQPQSQRGVRQ